jgi:hypothetical protein
MACALAANLAACYSRPLEPPMLASDPAAPAPAEGGSPRSRERAPESLVSKPPASLSAMSSPAAMENTPLAGARPMLPPPPTAREAALHLPAPCAGIPYTEVLHSPAQGPDQDALTWKLLSDLPRDLHFDATKATLSGTPVEGGSWRVSASASDGSTTIYTVDSSLRDNCWFAELTQAAADEPPQLHLRDVFLTSDVVLGASEPVRDFAFSPDGAAIAFRAEAGGQLGLFLYLIPETSSLGPAAQASPISFDCSGSAACSVLEYAWSPDSRRLAVALRDAAGNDYLSGLDRASPAQPWPSTSRVSWFADQVPLLFSEQLTWGDQDWFGFWGLEAGVPAEEYQVFHYAVVAEGQPLAVTALPAEYGPGPHLRALSPGVALSYADSRVITSIQRGAGEDSFVPGRTRGMLSPSGRLVGFANEDGRLQLSDPAQPELAPLESERGACSEIVGWSRRVDPSGVERVLCSSSSDLRVLDYVAGATGGALPPRIDPPGGTVIGTAGNFVATRRAFSPTGRFLLLADATSGNFSLLDLFTGNADTGLPLRLPAELAFAPTRDALAFANTESWIEFALPRSLNITRAYSTFGGAAPAIGALCEESFWQDPEGWCGAPDVSVHWSYSAQEQSMLLEGPVGSLSLIDLSVDPQRDAHPLAGVLPACPSPCRTKPYAFRP